MSTLPDFTGPGFFAGEAPDGLTTVVGTPQPAEVRVYWRDPEDAQAEDVFVASTLSASNGTWRIDNLNPELQYVVRGRKAGFDDVTVVGASPSRTDVIAVEDHLQPREDLDGLDGYVLMDSGLTPFTASVVDPLPFGLSPVIDGRKLLIEGVSDDEGVWQSTVRVTASNAVTVDVPVQVVIGLKAPVVTARYAVDGDWTITLQFAGASAFADELRVYRSKAAIDLKDLPVPVAVLDADVVKWVDEDVEPGQVYHYLVSAMVDGLQSFGAEVVRAAMWTPADLAAAPKIWLDDGSPVNVSAGAVTQWGDRSGNGLNFSQTTSANRPVLVEAALNGKRVVRFDGTNDTLSNTSAGAGNLVRNVGAAWFFSVYKKIAQTSDVRILFYAPNNTGLTRFNVSAGVTASPARPGLYTRRLDGDAAVSAESSEPQYGKFCFGFFEAAFSEGRRRIWINGQSAADVTAPSSGLTSNTAGRLNSVIIGSDGTAGMLDGDIACVLMGAGGSNMQTGDRQKLEGWAAWHYALTANLPADHPYKLTPP